MASIGRNDKCPCGSGQKYKKCCLLNGAEGIIEASVQKLEKRSMQRTSEYGKSKSLYVRDLKSVRKMSEIILEFAGPIMESAETFEMQRSAISVAMIAWNMSLMDDFTSSMENLSEKMKMPMDKQFASEMASTIRFLIQRKLEFYSDIRRMVMDYDVVDTGKGLHLNVVSTVLNDDAPNPKLIEELEQLTKDKKEFMSTL